MTNNKQQTAVEWLSEKVLHREWELLTQEKKRKILEQAKEMQQEQSQLYATFVLMCVNNNLPPITFNDWVTNIRR
jgi:LytS/YehU family sensor histidine kinase